METSALPSQAFSATDKGKQTKPNPEKFTKALDLLRLHGDDVAGELEPVLTRNLKIGRGLPGGLDAGDLLEDYIKVLVRTYQADSPYIRLLQVEKNETAWLELYEQLARWAYAYLCRKHFQPGDETMELAKEQATEACAQILKTHFPFDVSFALWSRRLLLNVCRKYLRTHGRRAKNLPTHDQPVEDMAEFLPAPRHTESEANQNMVRQDLLAGLAKLKESRAHVIRRYYFEEVPFAQIAEEMGRSVAAVHSLHFQALQSLRKHLVRYNYE